MGLTAEHAYITEKVTQRRAGIDPAAPHTCAWLYLTRNSAALTATCASTQRLCRCMIYVKICLRYFRILTSSGLRRSFRCALFVYAYSPCAVVMMEAAKATASGYLFFRQLDERARRIFSSTMYFLYADDTATRTMVLNLIAWEWKNIPDARHSLYIFSPVRLFTFLYAIKAYDWAVEWFV